MTTYLGLDLGTSGLRALLTDADGTPLASAEAPCTTTAPHPGWSEQDPGQWIAACRAALGDLRASHAEPLGAVAAIGLSGHMHGATLIGRDDRPLRPCMLWNDTRAGAEAARMDATPGIRDITANIVFPGFTAPKLMWVAAHEPETFAATDCVLLPKDALALWLTGDRVSEMSDAAGTSWLDVGGRDWSAAALAASGIEAGQMPRLIEGTAPRGSLRDAVADELGLPRGALVVGGGADNAAAACGTGVLTEGTAFVSLGTSGVVLAARDSFAPAPDTAVHTFCHAVPDRWYQMGVILAATDCLNWLARVTGQTPAALASAVTDLRAPGSVRFLPYLSGERTPWNDATIRAGFLGIGQATDTATLTRAVMEGVSFALADAMGALAAAGARPDRALVIGGGAQSDTWVRMIAAVLDLPLDLPAKGEFGAALGAARLAICGHTGADPVAVMTRPDIDRTIDPDPAVTARFADAYAAWRPLYAAIRAVS